MQLLFMVHCEIKKKEDISKYLPFCGIEGISIEHLIPILTFIDRLCKTP